LSHPPLKDLWEFFAENSIIPVFHPPYSPDLAPSDFWLFSHMKAVLARQQFPGPEELLTGIQEFVSDIQTSEQGLVFRHWIERV
jgi:transposase